MAAILSSGAHHTAGGSGGRAAGTVIATHPSCNDAPQRLTAMVEASGRRTADGGGPQWRRGGQPWWQLEFMVGCEHEKKRGGGGRAQGATMDEGLAGDDAPSDRLDGIGRRGIVGNVVLTLFTV